MNAAGFKDTLIRALTPGSDVSAPHRTVGGVTTNRGFAIEVWMARETATYIHTRVGRVPVTPAVTSVSSVGTRVEVRLSFTGPGLAESLTVYFTQSGTNMVLIINRAGRTGPEQVWRAVGRESRQGDRWSISTLESA